MKTRLFVAACATGIKLLSTMANAAVLPLEGRLETAPGSGVFLAYYDPNLDITWLADANAGAGSAFDDGFSTTDGKMTWANANAWASSLSIGGVSGWHLPSADVNGDGTVVDCDGGGVAGCEDTEMGFLYWEEGITDDTPGPFSNIQSEDYWSSTEFDSVFAWSFDFDFGFQDESDKEFRDIYAWAVRTGDVSAATDLVAAVLPASRSVQVGNPATAFATIINAGSATATGCGIAPLTSVQADFAYQTTDASNALTGTPDTPVDIAVGGQQSYVLAFTPTTSFSPVDVQLTFDCTNTNSAAVTAGVNTLLLVADSNPVPDMVALNVTPTGDGIVNLASTGVFSVATANVGSAGIISVSADTGSASLPVNISLCETNSVTAACINPTVPTLGTVTTSIAADATPTFAFFVTETANVPFDPATNRIFVHFKDTGGVTRGSTSVAVRSL